jgi:transcriptional regulator with XRE-family HTH domain
MDIKKQFGNRIRKIRESIWLSQDKLAFKSGIHRTWIGIVERGQRNLTLENIEKLAKALGVSIEELFKVFK